MLWILLSLSALAEPFEGTLVYKTRMSGEGVEAFAAMLPNGAEYHVRGGSLHMGQTGSMSGLMEVIERAPGETYLVDHADKALVRMPSQSPSVTVEATGNTRELAGITCHDYTVTAATPEGPRSQTVCTAPSIELGGLSKGYLAFEGMPGTALFIASDTQIAGMPVHIEQTITKVDRTPPSTTWFVVPEGYDARDYAPPPASARTTEAIASDEAPPEPVIDPADYELGLGTGGNGCGPTLGTGGLAKLRGIIDGSPTQLETASTYIRHNCLSAAQLNQLLTVFDSEEDRAAFRRVARSFVKDPADL